MRCFLKHTEASSDLTLEVFLKPRQTVWTDYFVFSFTAISFCCFVSCFFSLRPPFTLITCLCSDLQHSISYVFFLCWLFLISVFCHFLLWSGCCILIFSKPFFLLISFDLSLLYIGLSFSVLFPFCLCVCLVFVTSLLYFLIPMKRFPLCSSLYF